MTRRSWRDVPGRPHKKPHEVPPGRRWGFRPSEPRSGLPLVPLVRPGAPVLTLFRAMLLRKFRRVGLGSHSALLSTGRMRYYRGGSGPPLVFLHGFGGSALETWEKQVGAFAPHYSVVAPDLFWFGGSVPLDGHRMDSAAAHAEAVLELLDRLGLRRVHLVGVSFGGFVALELALRQPERLEKLVLVGPAGVEPTVEEAERVAAAFGYPEDIAEVLVPPDVEGLKRFLDTVFYRPRYIPRFVLRELLHQEFHRHREAKQRLCRGLLDQLRPVEELAEIAVRTLLVWGRHDPLLPPSIGERLARGLPNATLALLERSAHPPMLEEPARFNDVVLRFLAESPGRGR
ncbi:MAG: alpha/beta hydrolase [Deltaproteobacteria bacterium]|nr:alpha/beta hydrolase [Deltaproteobacteria bacterium]